MDALKNVNVDGPQCFFEHTSMGIETTCGLPYMHGVYLEYSFGFEKKDEESVNSMDWTHSRCSGSSVDTSTGGSWTCSVVPDYEYLICKNTLEVFEWMECVDSDTALEESEGGGEFSFSFYIDRMMTRDGERFDTSWEILNNVSVDELNFDRSTMRRLEVESNGLKSVILVDTFGFYPGNEKEEYRVTFTSITDNYPCSDLTYLVPVGSDEIENKNIKLNGDSVLAEDIQKSNKQEWSIYTMKGVDIFRSMPYRYSISFVPFTCPIGSHVTCIETREVITFNLLFIPKLGFNEVSKYMGYNTINFEWYPSSVWTPGSAVSIYGLKESGFEDEKRYGIIVGDLYFSHPVLHRIESLSHSSTEEGVVSDDGEIGILTVPALSSSGSDVEITLTYRFVDILNENAKSQEYSISHETYIEGCSDYHVYDESRRMCQERSSNFGLYLLLIFIISMIVISCYLLVTLVKTYGGTIPKFINKYKGYRMFSLWTS